MSIATRPPVEKPWSILYTKHCCTHVFAFYRTRGDAETALYRLRRIMPNCTLEVIWNACVLTGLDHESRLNDL